MAAINTASAIHITNAHRRPRIRSAHLPDPAFRHGYVVSTRADWRSTCAILSSTTSTPTLDLQDLVRITDLLPAPTHGSTLRVAYKGTPGADSEAAAAAKAYPDCDAVPCDQFEVAFLAVELWIADRAIVPIETSLGGSIPRNYDLLLRHRLHIVGELQLPHHHCLLTRFLVLAREPVVPRTDRPFKTSIVFAYDGEGTSLLFKVLSAFAFRNISLTKIESRPHRSNRPNIGTAKRFEYVFYLDFQASLAEPRAQNALAVIQELTSFLRVLGSYPMDTTPWGAATSPSSSSSSSAAD